MHMKYDAQVHDLIDKSKRLEGLPRHASMHAAGVVISQKARQMSMFRWRTGGRWCSS